MYSAGKYSSQYYYTVLCISPCVYQLHEPIKYLNFRKSKSKSEPDWFKKRKTIWTNQVFQIWYKFSGILIFHRLLKRLVVQAFSFSGIDSKFNIVLSWRVFRPFFVLEQRAFLFFFLKRPYPFFVEVHKHEAPKASGHERRWICWWWPRQSSLLKWRQQQARVLCLLYDP